MGPFDPCSASSQLLADRLWPGERWRSVRRRWQEREGRYTRARDKYAEPPAPRRNGAHQLLDRSVPPDRRRGIQARCHREPGGHGGGSPQTVVLAKGQRLEIRLVSTLRWQLTETDAAHILAGTTPEGWYDRAQSACIWR